MLQYTTQQPKQGWIFHIKVSVHDIDFGFMINCQI